MTLISHVSPATDLQPHTDAWDRCEDEYRAKLAEYTVTRPVGGGGGGGWKTEAERGREKERERGEREEGWEGDRNRQTQTNRDTRKGRYTVTDTIMQIHSNEALGASYCRGVRLRKGRKAG